MENKRKNKFTAIVMNIILAEIILLNILMPFPDSNDFYELSRLCSLMDSNVKYCVNSNWGFAHPAICWLLTKVTGNLLVAQRVVNATFTFLFIVVFLKFISYFEVRFTRKNLLLAAILISSPWVADLIVSVHIDIAPIALVFSGLLLLITSKRLFTIVLAGAIVGTSYWFRFHFLSFALLFPFLALFFKKDKLTYIGMFLSMTFGVVISILVPHILCKYVFGLYSISNEKFVMAQALGIADWSYGFAQKLDTITTAEMLKGFDYKMFFLKYVYHFLKSGVFPFLLIYGIVIFTYTKKCRLEKIKCINVSSRYYQILLIATYAVIAVVPFTIIRGFTYRLESAFVYFLFPVILWVTTNVRKKELRIIMAILLLSVIYHQVFYWKLFLGNRASVFYNSKTILANIPLSVLQKEPQNVICCLDFYNPYNKYLLCNPMVFAGWGVRFKPFVEHFGYLNLSNPYDNDIYINAKYIVIPANPEYFKYASDLVSLNKVVFKDKNILILSKEGPTALLMGD